MANRQRLVALARTFPTLTNAPLEPWDAERLDKWARTGSSGTVHAVRFVLAVWNSNNNNPAARVRRELLASFDEVFDRCAREASSRAERGAAERRLAGRADSVIDKVRERFLDGERTAAHGLALQAAALCSAWDPLARWLAQDRPTTEAAILGQLAKAQVWEVGPFDIMDALGTWDNEHRAAFVRWAAAPWWC